MIESWLAHLRQHERLSIADWEVQNIVLSFHQGEFPPHVTHLVAHKLPRKTRK